MHTTLNIDRNIFCSMTRLYSQIFNLPPLAAKIYSYLIFDFDRKGLTFDDLVEIFSASKSSISTNINLLLANELIIDVSKLDERKRYFTINNDYVKLRFNEILDKLKEEQNILLSLESFNRKVSDEAKIRMDVHKELLEKNIKNIEDSLSKL